MPHALGNDDFVPVILGTNLNAYNQARSLHEAFGVRSLALGRAALRETAHSKIVEVRAYREFDDPEFIVETLQEIAREFAGRKLLLYPDIEYYATVVLENRDRLADFLIPLVSSELADQIMTKTDFYATCERLGVPHPRSVIVAPEDAQERLGGDLPFSFPVVVKPSNTDTYPRLQFAGKQKIYVVKDRRELESVVSRIFAAGYEDEIVVQEFIAGDESVMQVANTYSDASGRLRFVSVGQVALTEYDPALIGNNNAIISTADEALTESLQTLLDGLGYVGYANFDIMFDRRDGTSQLLEINLRQGATSFYTMAGKGNITRCAVDDLVYGKQLPWTVVGIERLWINLPLIIALIFIPKSMRGAALRALRRPAVHTLRYRRDFSPRRAIEVARIDLRQTLAYFKYFRTRNAR
ncbi:carboxylate--amine ligase [Rarobacter faecitabidus]|uniref:D-aspartate ligase n=1 Tax=Rarobacter faecitabidus TaxID=13243 RepID=A0A542ZW16_RARFA|nr:hypothetical protein [Rarobacter faecitabidus]TQL64553.1 D-aspartate ligase [Rarobacter faecitabidus]